MKKFFGLLVIVLAVAFTSQANGAGNDSVNVGYDICYDLPIAQAIVDNTFAEPTHSTVTTVVVNYTSEGGFEVACIVSDTGTQNYNFKSEFATNTKYNANEPKVNKNSNDSLKTTTASTNLSASENEQVSTSTVNEIVANVGKLNSNI